jgi:hypothetical protein
VPVGKAIARSVSVRGATEKRVRKPCNIDEQRLARGDRARPHAAAGRGIERVSTKILNGRETQGIDRCLGDNQSWKRRTLQRQSKERLCAPRQRAFVSRASDIHVRNGAGVIEMGEPGTADGTLPQNSGHGRRLYGRWRQPALSSEVAPGRRVRPNRPSLGPAGGDGSVRILSAPCPIGRRKTWRQSGERSQALADMSEAKPWLEPLHEAKNVALSVARWIPPTTTGMADDQDLTFASSIL